MFTIAGALGSIPYVAMALLAVYAYNGIWENPRIREEARAGMVAKAELSAAQSELSEQRRQAQAAIAATTAFAEALRQNEAKQREINAAEQKRLSEYAEQIKKQGRSCILNDDDVRELSK